MEATLVNKYPEFSRGQLLNHDQLNTLFQYLDGQNKGTRRCLIGAGIFYGLKVHPDKKTIVISSGAGLTSDGKLVCLKETTLNLYRDNISIPKAKLCPKQANNGELIGGIIELYDEEKDNQNNYQKIEDLKIVKSHVLIIYIEEEHPSSDNKKCIQSFDPSITYINVNTRFLLIDKEKIKDCLETWDPAKLVCSKGLPLPRIPRFGITTENIDNQTKLAKPAIALKYITSLEVFIKNYLEVCLKGIDNKTYASGLYNVLSNEQVLAYLKPLLADEEDNVPLKERVENWKKFWDEFINNNFNVDNKAYFEQYVYDYLEDFILAYEELMNHSYINFLRKLPEENCFPNHLVLGCIEKVNTNGIIYNTNWRTPLIRLPFDDYFNERLDEVVSLAKRLRKFLNPLVPQFKELELVKIIPSKGKIFPLSERAIPYYYNQEFKDPRGKGILDYWSYAQKRKERELFIPTYDRTDIGDGKTSQPLLFDMERFEFFRIEGHVGKELVETKNTIVEERDRLNLPFDVICLRLGNVLDNQVNLGTDDFLDLERDYQESKLDLCVNVDRLDINQELKKELQNTLPDSLSAFNYEQFKVVYERVKKISQGQWPYPPDCEERTMLERLSSEYSTRIDKYLEQQAFHVFAESHPGMEHLAGVPKGGTFILVYIEENLGDDNGEEVEIGIYQKKRTAVKKTVVADFCLPYYCCSKGRTNIGLDDIIKPLADFTWEKTDIFEREEPYNLCVLTKQRYVFKNLSENGHFYAWSIDNIQQALHFDKQDFIKEINLKELNAGSFEAELLAIRNDSRHKKEEIINLCPANIALAFQISGFLGELVTVPIHDKDSNNELPYIILSRGGTKNLLNITPNPFGGRLQITAADGTNEVEGLDFSSDNDKNCADSKDFKMEFSKVEVSQFNLSYGFSHCDNALDYLVKIENVILDFDKIDEEFIYQKDGEGNDTCTIVGIRAEFKNKSYQENGIKKLDKFNWYVKEFKSGGDNPDKLAFTTEDIEVNFSYNFMFEEKFENHRFEVKLQGLRENPVFYGYIPKQFDFCMDSEVNIKLQQEINYGDNEKEIRDLEFNGEKINIEINKNFSNVLIVRPQPSGGHLYMANADGTKEEKIAFNKDVNSDDLTCYARIPLNEIEFNQERQLTYYILCNQTSFTLMVSGEIIIASETTGNTGGNVSTTNITSSIFSERKINYNHDLNSLGSADQELTTRKVYQSTQGFIDIPETSKDLAALYTETATQIISAYKKAKEDKKESYAKLFNALTHSFLDKAVMLKANEVIPEVKEELGNILAKAKEAELDVAKLKRDWKGAELKKAYQSKAVGEYQKLLK